MKVAGTKVESITNVEKITIYLNLTKNQIGKVETADINLIETTVDDLKKKNEAIEKEQGENRAFRLNRISDLGHKVADGGNYFSQKERVSPRFVVEDLETQGFILTDVRAEWKQAHGNGRLALEFQRNPEKKFELTDTQNTFCQNLLKMAYTYMHPYLNPPSAIDSMVNMTFNFVKRMGEDHVFNGISHLRLDTNIAKFFCCVSDAE